MRRHSTYGSTLDPLSRSGTMTASVTPGGMFASALTDAGRALSSGDGSRGTFTVPTLSADVYTPGGGTGTGTGTASSTFPDVNAGMNFLPFDAQPSQTVTPDYMRAQSGAAPFSATPGYQTTRPRYTVPTKPTRPAGAGSAPSGRGRAPFVGPSRATLPGGRRTLPLGTDTTDVTDTTEAMPDTSDTYTVPDVSAETYEVPVLDTRGGIGGYLKGGYVVPVMPRGVPAVRKGAQEKKAAAAPAPVAEAGFPWGWLLLAVGVGGAYLFTRKKGSAS